MEGNKLDPKRRKSIHEKVTYDEICDNVKNAAMRANTKRMHIQQYDDSNEDMVISDDDASDLSEEELLINRTYKIDRTKSRTQRHSVPPENIDAPSFENVIKNTTKTVLNTSSTSKSKITKPIHTPKTNNNCNHQRWFYVLALAVVVLFIAYKVSGQFDDTLDSQQTLGMGSNVDRIDIVLNDVKETLKNLRSEYKNQNKKLWQDAYFGISSLLRRPYTPSIIVLLGNKSDTIDCLAILLGNVSSNALNSGRLTLTPNEFESDVGSVIENMRERLKQNKVVVISDLLNINAEALRAFHNLCDRENPLVKEVIYIITIVVNNYDKSKNPLEFIENELKKKLSGKVKLDAIQPLITRITDGPILTVEPEPTITTCPFSKAPKKN